MALFYSFANYLSTTILLLNFHSFLIASGSFKKLFVFCQFLLRALDNSFLVNSLDGIFTNALQCRAADFDFFQFCTLRECAGLNLVDIFAYSHAG